MVRTPTAAPAVRPAARAHTAACAPAVVHLLADRPLPRIGPSRRPALVGATHQGRTPAAPHPAAPHPGAHQRGATLLPLAWLVVLLSVLGAGLALACGPTPAGELMARVGDDWDAGFEALDEGDWRFAFGFGLRVADLPPEQGWALVERHWHGIDNPAARRNLLKAFHSTVPYPLHARLHPHLLDVLHLGMQDPDEEVREWAASFISNVAMEDLQPDTPEYERWITVWRGRPLAEAYLDGMARWVARTRDLERDELVAALEFAGDHWNVFRDVTPVREAADELGLHDLLADVAAGPEPDAAAEALKILQYLPPDRRMVDEVILPRLGPDQPGAVRASASMGLARSGDPRALELLLEQVVHHVTAEAIDRSLLWTQARAVAELGDLSAAPTLIAAIELDGSYDTVYGLGYFGLGQLLDVDYDESHDGAWWRSWWAENRQRLGPGVAGLEIPTLVRDAEARAAAPAGTLRLPADVAHVPLADLALDGDERRRVLVHGPFGAAPPAGYRVLLVLPGGEGSAEFAPFVARLADQQVGDGYVVAQLVAPKWDADQFERLVWPTASRPWPGMAFGTEDLAREALEAVAARHPVDRRSVFSLSWSSGGPAAYDLALLEDTPVTGSLVMMSVFKPDQLEPLERAAGRAFAVAHARQDFIPFAMAESAVAVLADHGAATTLLEYEGGHGWNGRAMARAGEGLRWLEQQVARER